MSFFTNLFGGGEQSRMANQQAGLVWKPPLPLDEDDYVNRCLHPEFNEQPEDRTFRDSPAFAEVLAFLNADQYRSAIKQAIPLLAQFEDFDLPYKWLGSAYRETGKLEASRDVLAQGVSKAKRKAILLTDLGETEWQMGNLEAALYAWSQALHCLSANPIDYNAYLLVSYVAEGLGCGDASSAFLRRVDQLRAGQVRLNPRAATRLTALAKKRQSRALKSVVIGLQNSYLITGKHLHSAVEAGDLAKLSDLLRRNQKLINAPDNLQRTPLHIAASKKKCGEILEFLIAQGADVNAKDKAGWTPLHNAAFLGHASMVKSLLANHADANLKSVMMVITGTLGTNVTLPEGTTPLHAAIRGAASPEVLRDLMTNGADVDGVDGSGLSPSQLAKSAKKLDLSAIVSGARDAAGKTTAQSRSAEATAAREISSPDGKRTAKVAQKGEKWTVVADGVEGKAYDAVLNDSLRFSPNGRRLAYGAKTGCQWVVVVDGVEGKGYDAVAWLTFSPDGERMAYAAKVDGKWMIVVDGVEGKAHDNLIKNTLVFSPNGQRVAYGAEIGGKCVVVVDGVEGRAYDALILLMKDTLVFSPNSQRIAYAARNGDKKVVVVDGVEGKAYDAQVNATLIFSPNSRRIAYAAVIGGKWAVVVDGGEGKAYEAVARLTFSPDGQRMAHAAKVDGKWMIVVDGVEGKAYDGLAWTTFSPDGQRVAYAAKVDGKWMVVVDGVEGKVYDDLVKDTLVFSPNSLRMAYGAGIGGKCVAVVDGVEGKAHDALILLMKDTLIFSPNSQRIAYAARNGDKRVIVVDGVEGKGYYTLASVAFSPDSERVAHAAKAEVDGKWMIVVDGVEGKAYEDPNQISLADVQEAMLSANQLGGA